MLGLDFKLAILLMRIYGSVSCRGFLVSFIEGPWVSGCGRMTDGCGFGNVVTVGLAAE